jgi:hypothetical protein
MVSCAAALGAVLLLAPAPAFADVSVRGTPEAARVEAQGGSVEEVLSALDKAFGLRWQSPAPLNRRLTGTYEGPLNRVVARVLDGYNFVLKASGGRLEIAILGPRGGQVAGGSAAGAPAAAKVAPTPAAKPATPKPAAPAAPVLAAAATQVAAAVEGPVPTPTKVAEAPVPMPMTGQGAVAAPEPIPSTVPPPMPGQGAAAVPELLPSTAAPPVPVPQPQGGVAAPSEGGPPAGGPPPAPRG